MPARSGRRHTLVLKSKGYAGRKVYLGGGKRVYGGLRKTSKPGAYNKGKKKNFQIRRAPFVETKSRVAEEVAVAVGDSTQIVDPTQELTIPNDDALTMVPMVSMLTQHQGLEEDSMIGNSLYARFLKCKMQFMLPDGFHAIQHSADLYVVAGWVKAPYSATSFTTITPQNVLPTVINDHIAKHVKDFFDEREDKLRFIPKVNTNIKITHYNRIKPNRNGALGVPSQVYGTTTAPTGYKVAGGNPVINHSVTWKINRKLHYTHGKSLGSYSTMFLNSSWLPFLTIYNPTYAQFTAGTDYRIKFSSNNCFWYSDS
jgi:hypothetical protein